MNKILIVTAVLLLSSCGNKELSPLYMDKDAPVEKRIDDLIGRMTLEEKILQMNQWSLGRNLNKDNIESRTRSFTPGIGSYIYQTGDPEIRNVIQKRSMDSSRLGIPIIFGYDVIHGHRTVYPIPLAVACAWNPDLYEKACAMAAREAKLSGIDWTFSPMIDVSRDGRWGRISECFGEDPYTNAVFCVSAVKGYQGKSLSDPYSIAACLKHFVGYGMSEGGRDYHYSEVSDQSLWDTYLVPYEAGVKAGVATLMSAFNDISGTPATSNHYTLTEILKNKWKHDGFVVSDWNAIVQLINQGVARDSSEAGIKALMAGVEMDMVDNIYNDHMPTLVEQGKVPMKVIDEAVRRILRVKFRLGLFENPYTAVIDTSERYLLPEYREIAEKLAEESMVLMKNDNNILPLQKNVKSIALIGPMVKDRYHIIGDWRAQGKTYDALSILEGIKKEFGNNLTITFSAGCGFDGNDESGFRDAVAAASKSDVAVVCLGEKWDWSGENASRSTIAYPQIQEKLVEALFKTGKPVILVLSSGRPLELVRLEPMAKAILQIWQPGLYGGPAAAGIISGRVNPSGKLSVTFPLTTGQIPVYYDMRQSARPKEGLYQDIPTVPLYWFGHGLSYTTFSYGTMKLSASKFSNNERITAEVEVTNTGSVTGKETVFWYIKDPACSISRPMKELKYFEKKEIKPGETVSYKFEIDPSRDLGFVDSKGEKFLETGDYYIIVNDQKLKIELTN